MYLDHKVPSRPQLVKRNERQILSHKWQIYVRIHDKVEEADHPCHVYTRK